jgi:glucose repression regulatory protein TUP1
MSCDLSVRGFNTKAALKSHTRLYHSKATDEPAPIIRRKKAMQLKKAALEKEATLEKEDFEAAGNALAELDLERLPGHLKHVGSDWFAIFNPAVPRVLDVDLVHALEHQSVVCCVTFSYDGQYIATGCNRVAQIFDVVTGQKIVILEDESVNTPYSLYIRSVCFSPDARYLATGGDDKLIRVSNNIDLYVLFLTNTGLGHRF